MQALIVHAHPEVKSFNSAMARLAQETLSRAGYAVSLSDLYAMGFDPVSDRRNFTTVADRDYFRQQSEEAHACTEGGFAPGLQAEMDKLARRDLLILQFPICAVAHAVRAVQPLDGAATTDGCAGMSASAVCENGLLRGRNALGVPRCSAQFDRNR